MFKFSQMIINENKTQKFKVSLDFHGVIDVMPDFFAFLSNAIIQSGGELHIVTGGTLSQDLEDKLTKFGIKWTHIFSVYKYLVETDAVYSGFIKFPDGSTQKKFEGKTWDEVKGKYCQENGIHLHIDDMLIYNEYFKTPFAKFWSHKN